MRDMKPEYLFGSREKPVKLPCAICGDFFCPHELTDGLCPECWDGEETAWVTETEEEPF